MFVSKDCNLVCFGGFCRYCNKLRQRTLYLTVGNSCLQFQSEGDVVTSKDVPELRSSQEEADTRMFLHAKHAADTGHHKVCHYDICQHCDPLLYHTYMYTTIPHAQNMHVGIHVYKNET